MHMDRKQILSDTAMQAFGQDIASQLQNGDLVFLQGDLGAGKTTLARGILHGLGVEGHIKSPTYTIVEPYQVNDQKIYHFDLYRISSPQELCEMGFDDYFTRDAIILVEWPEKASLLMSKPDLTCVIEFNGEGREIELTWVEGR